MTDYTRLDKAILAAIKAGKNTLHQLEVACYTEAMACMTPKDLVFRAIDRRLQSMRKAGKLAWSRATDWRIA